MVPSKQLKQMFQIENNIVFNPNPHHHKPLPPTLLCFAPASLAFSIENDYKMDKQVTRTIILLVYVG